MPSFSSLSAIFLVAICTSLAAAGHGSSIAGSQDTPAGTAREQSAGNPAAEFKFTQVDDDLYNESAAVDQQFEKKGLVMHDPGLQAYLDSVGKRVLGERPVPEKVEFHFKVLRDPMVNAFALPNGSIYVTTGLFSLLENEAQLAGILGHETAHVYDRHGYLEYRSMRKKALTVNILAIAGSRAPIGPNAVGLFGVAVWAGAEMSSLVLIETVYGYSREMERQADSDGIVAMSAAGYDPHAMARSFELLDEDSKREYEPVATFYHDHPKLTARRADALKFAESHMPSEPRVGDERDYLAAVSPAIVYNITADLESRRARTAVARASKMVDIFPDDPKYQVLLGEGFRTLGAKTAMPAGRELTPDGEAHHRTEYFKMTEQEEQQELMTTPEGGAALEENRAKAEKLFQGVIKNHPDYAAAYRELGFLYEDEKRYGDAAGKYRHYLDLVASTSLDHLRIERRLANAENLEAAKPAQKPSLQPAAQQH